MIKFGIQNLLFVVVLVGLPLLMLYAFNQYNAHKALEYFGPVTKDANGTNRYHEVGDFELTNQDKSTVTLADVGGKVYVSNFFFASCPSICPQMMNQLSRVQEIYGQTDDFHILSFTVDPIRDSAVALKRYGAKYGVEEGKWDLLTGNKKEIYKLARNSFLVVANEGDGGPTDFIHSEKLVLADRYNRIRGYYDGTEPEEVDKLIKDIEVLLKSE